MLICNDGRRPARSPGREKYETESPWGIRKEGVALNRNMIPVIVLDGFTEDESGEWIDDDTAAEDLEDPLQAED